MHTSAPAHVVVVPINLLNLNLVVSIINMQSILVKASSNDLLCFTETIKEPLHR